ncbi:MAG TPA: gliding motility-associated C-terminal domain-containing protein [Cryomorphaceae bacterium]|nr:gliding motility-associated C-terminal domain-containing protein [Cryomorphaceae bacterium]
MKNEIAKVLGVCILIMFTPFFSKSAHITGGDFTVRHVEGNTFEFTLTLYRDCESGGAGFDEIVGISAFDALTDEPVPELDFDFTSFETFFPELGNSCFVPSVCLEIGVYTIQRELPDNPNGYYFTNERCCRNDLSVNLAGTFLGFVFTVEVADPALQNSTPEFGDYPAEAYLCVNGENNIDLGASDEEGDSLVYSLSEALKGDASSLGEPIPLNGAGPQPYTTIDWAAGFGTDNQVGGVIPMTIDSETGVITALPEQIGVFTIAVLVEEYREGQLISTIRRELQLTSTGCQFDLPSVINTPNGDTIFDVLANTGICVPIAVTDPNEGDTLFVQGEGGILDGTIIPQAIFPDANGFSNIEQDFCWSPVCENLQDSLYLVTLTAFSRGCANEVLVTEQDIYFNVILEEDETTLLDEPMDGEVTIDLYDPSTHCFDFVFVDPNEADTVFVNPSSTIFDLPNVDELDLEVDQGTVTLPFCWNVTCEDVSDEPYFIDFEVIATNCEVQDTVNFSVPINVVVPPDEAATFIQPADTVYWEYYSTDTFCMPITFVDPNFFDTLEVTATSEIFNLLDNPAFMDTLQGLVQLDGNLCWIPQCSDVREEPYIINFTGTSESCKTNETVEKTIVLYLELPPENPPMFELPLPGFAIEHSIGDDLIEFDLLVTDADLYDTLTLSTQGSVFTNVTNVASLNGSLVSPEAVFGQFSWLPDCPDVEEVPYVAIFTVVSESCQKSVTRTLEVPIIVSTPTMGIIEPIQNIFTPNGDGLNEFWTIENQDDPCLLNFSSVVYDRWGKEVFRTNDPAFRWEGNYGNGNEAVEGQYFQTIEYFYKDATKNFTGNITLSR